MNEHVCVSVCAQLGIMLLTPATSLWTWYPCSFNEKDVQRDMKLVSYDIVDKNGKPYVAVDVGKDRKVR